MSRLLHPQEPSHILVVEDEPDIRELLQEVLSEAGLVVSTAEDGATGLQAFIERRPDLVLMDARMPKLDGHELCRCLRALPGGAETPVLMLTAVTDDASVEQAFAAGVTDFIEKPANMAVLVQRVRRLAQAQRSRELLRGSEDHYRQLIDTIPDMIYTVAIPEGTIRELNSAFEAATGWPRAAWLGKPFRDLVHPEDRQRADEELERVRRGEQPEPYVLRLRTEAGHALRCEFTCAPERRDGVIVGKVGIARDITRRTQQEQVVREAEARYRTLIEHFPGAAVFLFDQELRYTVAGGTGLAGSGLTPELFVGKTLREIFPPEVAARDEPVLRAALQGEVTRLEVPFGSQTFFVQTVPVADKVGAIVGGMVVSQNITERKQTEQDLRMVKEEAERANLAKSEFLSRMSHELRTPLNAILGFAQVLEFEDLSIDERESVEHILKAGRHLLQLINEVLEISRIETGRLSLSIEPVDVQEVLEETLELVRPLAGPWQVRLPTELPAATAGYVMADRQRLKQVLINLVSNAIKYNREGGTVELACQAADDRLRMLVSDTGIGIAADHFDRLFMPFDRLGAESTEVEGSGLGLALSKRLVELMGGTLGVESMLGIGSTFWVEFPLGRAPLERLDLTAVPVEAPRLAGPGATVLYIEDNLANLQLIERLLTTRTTVRLLAAMQGRLGLELAREHHPDLILLDLHLPDLPGWEVLADLQADAAMRDIPVVVLSADATPRQVERLLAAGAHAYLTKPLDVRQFLTVLDETLAQKDA